MPSLPATQPPQTQSVLISYFLSGNTPTQEQFAELIATMFYYMNLNAAQGAQANANVNNALCITAWLDAITTDAAGTLNIIGSSNIAGVTKVSAGKWAVSFTNALEDTNYEALYQSPAWALGSKTVNGFNYSTGGGWPAVNTRVRFALVF
jgi:hypothetical protein